MDLENEEHSNYRDKLLSGFDARLRNTRRVLFRNTIDPETHSHSVFDADIADPILYATRVRKNYSFYSYFFRKF